MEVLPSASFVRKEHGHMTQCLLPCSALARSCIETWDFTFVQELSEPYPTRTGLGKQCALCFPQPFVELEYMLRWRCVFKDYSAIPWVCAWLTYTSACCVFLVPSPFPVLYDQLLLIPVPLLKWLFNPLLYPLLPYFPRGGGRGYYYYYYY